MTTRGDIATGLPTRRIALKSAISVLALVSATFNAGAVEEPKPGDLQNRMTFSDAVELTIVNIIAYVTDKDGNPITDLTQDDFRIFQDGEERPISNFQFFVEETVQEANPLPPDIRAHDDAVSDEAPSRQPVNMILYVDNANLHPLDRNQLMPTVVRFVRQTLRPPMQMMVVSFSSDLKVLQPFTDDPDLVVEALRTVRTFSGGRPERDTARQEVLDRMHNRIERQGLTTGYGTHSRQTYSDILVFADEEAFNLSSSMDGLREVVALLTGLPGRRAVLYVSNGLPMIPGFELFNAYADTIRDPTILTEIQRYDRSSNFRSLVESANAQDVSFYTVGAGGLEVTGMSRGEHRSSRHPVVSAPRADTYLDGLRYMADATGGLAIVKTNDFETGLDRVRKDLSTYYSLGYRLVPSGKDKVHSIEVTIPGRPDAVIRYRNRMVERSLETRVQERVIATLRSHIDENPFDLEVEVLPTTLATSERWSVPLRVSFPMDRVATVAEAGNEVGRILLFVAALDSEGKQSDPIRQEFEIRVPASKDETHNPRRVAVNTSLLMTVGTYRIGIGVLDQVTGQASYLSTNTRVGSP